MSVLFVKNYAIFLNLHVISNLLFFIGASTLSEDTDGIQELISSMRSVHDEEKAPPDIFNEHILFKYVYFDRKVIYSFVTFPPALEEKRKHSPTYLMNVHPYDRSSIYSSLYKFSNFPIAEKLLL